MKLSIIIPAHNEEHRLPAMLAAYAEFFSQKYSDEVELIVVPNFCDDKTAEVAKKEAEYFPQIRVLDDPGRVGKGGAVICGAKEAVGELVGFVDADGATQPPAFDDLVEKIGSAGCIIASRWMKESEISPRQPLSRRISSRCFNMFVRTLFGLKLSDTQCGAKIFRADVMEYVLKNLGVTNWAFDVDMLFQAKRADAEICEIPTVWHDKAGSKIRIVRSSVSMFVALVRLRLYYSPFRGAIRPLSCLVSLFIRYRRR